MEAAKIDNFDTMKWIFDYIGQTEFHNDPDDLNINCTGKIRGIFNIEK